MPLRWSGNVTLASWPREGESNASRAEQSRAEQSNAKQRKQIIPLPEGRAPEYWRPELPSGTAATASEGSAILACLPSTPPLRPHLPPLAGQHGAQCRFRNQFLHAVACIGSELRILPPRVLPAGAGL